MKLHSSRLTIIIFGALICFAVIATFYWVTPSSEPKNHQVRVDPRPSSHDSRASVNSIKDKIYEYNPARFLELQKKYPHKNSSITTTEDFKLVEEQRKKEINWRQSDLINKENSALIAELAECDVTAVEKRLNSGLDPNVPLFKKMYGDQSMLDWAIANNHLECVKLLVERGAYINLTAADLGRNSERYSERELHLPVVAAVWSDNIQILEYLVSKGADVNRHEGGSLARNALTAAIEISNLPMVYWLLTHGADINEALNKNGEMSDWIRWRSLNPNDPDNAEAKEVVNMLVEYGAAIPSGDLQELKDRVFANLTKMAINEVIQASLERRR